MCSLAPFPLACCDWQQWEPSAPIALLSNEARERDGRATTLMHTAGSRLDSGKYKGGRLQEVSTFRTTLIRYHPSNTISSGIYVASAIHDVTFAPHFMTHSVINHSSFQVLIFPPICLLYPAFSGFSNSRQGRAVTWNDQCSINYSNHRGRYLCVILHFFFLNNTHCGAHRNCMEYTT